MKTFKLVGGILTIILSVLITLQSCAAGISNALDGNGEIGGTAGLFLAIMMMTGGIVMIASRGSEKRGGAIACMILFVLGAAVGAFGAGSYTDLNIWAVISLIFGIINLILVIRYGKKKPEKAE